MYILMYDFFPSFIFALIVSVYYIVVLYMPVHISAFFFNTNMRGSYRFRNWIHQQFNRIAHNQ